MCSALRLFVLAILILWSAACQEATRSVKAPESPYRVRLQTSKGDIVLRVHPQWAPVGAARFHELVHEGFFADIGVFRHEPGFVVQFGISGDPTVAAQWKSRTLEDDPVTQSNLRGRVTYATAGPGTRTTQLFINVADNTMLDSLGFAPFAEVVDGMEVVARLHRPAGKANQAEIHRRGNAYLHQVFPKLDYIKSASLLRD